MDVNPLSLLPPQWQGQLKSLSRGTTNHSWQLTTEQGRYWLRLGCSQPARLGIDRHQELMAHQLAAQLGLAPAIRFAQPNNGILLLDWIDEADWGDMPGELSSLIPRIVQLHHQQPPWPVFDFRAHSEHYLKQLSPLSGELKAFADHFTRPALNPAFSAVLCHHDLNVTNVLGARPWLIDWEYAALSDSAFELAVLADSLDLSTAQAHALVSDYQQAGGKMSWSRFQARRPWVYWLTALWAALQYINTKELHYMAQQETALARLESILPTL